MAAAQMVPAKAGELSTDGQALGQKTRRLKTAPLPETPRVLDELLVVAIVASQIGGKAIRYMLDAAADRGVVQHIDDRAVHVGNGHAGLMAPDALRAEELLVRRCASAKTARHVAPVASGARPEPSSPRCP